MKLLNSLAYFGLIVMGLVIIATVSTDSIWEDEAQGSPTTGELANALLLDWPFAFLMLGVLLAMALVGAAYLVRDERKENLEWEMNGGEL
jgi:NADH:ubiquinone oxidoreductase subunit 6 (subunit J)